jgi:hypothetical protein
MSTPRLATIPFEHVEAEIGAFPLASEASFRLGTISLNPRVSRGSNDKLWRHTERFVLNALPSVPLDEAVAIRDKLWFDSSSLRDENPSIDQRIARPVSLLNYLRRLASGYLNETGRPLGKTSSHVDTPEARLRWSWMCQALPPDLLRVASRVVDADASPFTLDDELAKTLNEFGFAETHLHLGAALDFSLSWAALMRGLATTESKHDDFESPGACFSDGRDLSAWLSHSAVVRLVLAEWLFGDFTPDSSLNNLLQSAYDRPGRLLDPIERLHLRTLLAELKQGSWFESRRSSIATAPQEALKKRFAQTRNLYRHLIGSGRLVQHQRIGGGVTQEPRHRVFTADPLAHIVGWTSTETTSPETVFIQRALERIKQDKRHDSDFARLFWQIVRVRCLLYRHVVQRPLTPGLQWFVRFFSRIKPLRKNISETVLLNTAAHLSGRANGLRSLEVRLGTEKSISACWKKVCDVEDLATSRNVQQGLRLFRRLELQVGPAEKPQAANIEVGALFHFSRKRGGGWEFGRPNAYGLDHSYPGMLGTGSKRLTDAGNPTGFRFARFYMEQRRHAQALVSVLETHPSALRTFRGVDLCTDEAGVPVWVMAPLVRWVRAAGHEAAVQLRRRGITIPPPRTSIHAGEDFVHLLTGLRRLDEAVTYLSLERGDRLGHGLSLGIDPSIWFDRVGRVVQTREERLFDLVWEWGCYIGSQGILVANERLDYLEPEILRLAAFIFGWSCRPEDLLDLANKIHDEHELGLQGFPDQPTLGALRSHPTEVRTETNGGKPKGRLLLWEYLHDESVWRNGRVPEIIDLRTVKHELLALKRLQDGLRRKIGKQGLVIEVNPSSNLLVGDLGNFLEHPLWRLRPVAPYYDGKWYKLPQYLGRSLVRLLQKRSSLSVCIGSDDPLTFATELRHEYQLLFDAMILMGHSHEEAMKWIDEARDAGMQSRFTLPPDVDQISQGLRVPNLLGWERPDSPP